MISDQQLASREREITKLFLGLRTTAYLPSDQCPATDRIRNAVPSPAQQRIEQILRRVENERNDDRRTGNIDILPHSTGRHLPGD